MLRLDLGIPLLNSALLDPARLSSKALSASSLPAGVPERELLLHLVDRVPTQRQVLRTDLVRLEGVFALVPDERGSGGVRDGLKGKAKQGRAEGKS